MGYPYLYHPSGPSAPSSVLAVCTVLPILCIVAVALRFNVRRLQKATCKLDDWIMLPALILVVGMGIRGIIGVEKRVLGYPTPKDRSRSDFALQAKLLLAFWYIQITAVALIKFGALAFYHRIFCSNCHRGSFNWVIIGTFGVACLWTVAMLFMRTFQCGIHVDAFWTSPVQSSKYCGAVGKTLQAFSISNFILDFWIIFLPIPKIFTLQLSLARKFGLSGVFLLALVGLAASLAHMTVIVQTGDKKAYPNVDSRLISTLCGFWSVLEAGLCLLAVNLPPLWAYRTIISSGDVLTSIRSIFSSQSLRSNRSRNSGAYDKPLPVIEKPKGSSYSRLVTTAEIGEPFAMHDLEAQQLPIPCDSRQAILVKSSIWQESSSSSIGSAGRE